ncbi:phage tail sheath C-terminal domain-containing protein [Chryseobacterium sp. EO14]|uniref:phage tail sheath family protein n=1 Tax=Chryseobacterium sp. EO14 TaxID=2950551 RepID=UPI00210D47CC|nr:phage tail sheath C-terminal domain-containing protein [Chryseobacterium sp. EO14]MCQ4139092.1 phage tail sheath family protein [Chryseobacterium sp. EO14]
MNYKTPGVYVEEEAKFPPSVAQVETAIPAFIGYTEKGTQNKPTRISSMLEFEELFGKAYAETFAVAFKDGAATAVQPKVSDFKMYYAMQMYFVNGGGPCYIVSVGDYEDDVTVGTIATQQGTLLYGLELLKKEDEPTLIVFPDLQSLIPAAEDIVLAEIAAEVTENNKLVATAAKNAAEAVANTLDGEVLRTAIANAVAKANSYKIIESNDPIKVAEAQAAQTVIVAIQNAAVAPNATVNSVKSVAQSAVNVFQTDLANATAIALVATTAHSLVMSRKEDEDGINKELIYSLYDSALDQAESMKDRFVIMDVLGDDATFRNKVTSTGLKYGAAYYPNLKTILTYAFKEDKVSVMGASGVTTLAELKLKNSELYNQAKAAIESQKVVLAPSSTMAGVYAKVDSTSGVFKAPANTGLNYVDSPVIKISNKRQDELNVDSTSGKSINVIRSFTGKGTLVWGARTLDGNSNEWRYISVRRFFNMVEESVKKATERFVFEPNTANTWVRVQTMIENFLNQQWQDGALAGSKPEEAYYVSVGLNKTMSAQDILEGRMIVEIGMAAVRPAEFIVLRFSHKLQEA